VNSPLSSETNPDLRDVMMGSENISPTHISLRDSVDNRDNRDKDSHGTPSPPVQDSVVGAKARAPTSPPDPLLAALRFKRMYGVLRVLLTLPQGQTSSISINGKENNYYMDESAQNGVTTMPRTHHFHVQGREPKKLYWFEQYAALMTPSHAYFEFCALSNGDVCVGVWETRCNRPFHAMLIYHPTKCKCELFTTHNWRQIHPNVVFNPDRAFDMAEAVK
jgi:hypothetical protein